MNIYTIILTEFLLLSSSILLLFKLRSKLGLAPLYILLGAVQFLQANLGNSLSFIFLDEFVIYPGSIILFSGVLSAVLLVYIKEGVASARALIIGIVVSNIAMSLMFEITYLQQIIVSQINNTAVDLDSIFNINFKYLFSGTTILLIDFLLLVILYQYLILKFKKLPFFLVLFISFWAILVFDAIAFNVALFYGTPIFKTSISGHLLGKSVAAVAYSIVLYLYVKYLDNNHETTTFIANQERNIFSIINYRKKYKDLKIQKQIDEEKLTSQIEITLNNISDGFISLDANWCYTYINKKAAEFLNRSPESLIGKNIWSVFPEGVGLPIYKTYHKAFETQKTIYFEDYYEPLDRWYENRVYPSADGLTIYFTDITARKVADTNNQMLFSLIETSDDFVGLADLKGKPIYLNINGRKLVGLDANEKLLASILDFFPEDYQETIANEHMPSIFKNDKWNGEAQFKNFKTGDLIPIEMSGFTIKDSTTNKPIALGIVATDITERKKSAEDLINSELLFRRLTSNAPVGIFQTDKEGSVNYVNEEWLDYAGMSFNEALGFGWSNAIHPDDKERVVKAWQQYVETRGEFAIEFRFQDKKNKIKWISVKAVETFDANNNLYGYIGMALDISERKEAEKQLKSSKNYLDNIINNIGDPVFVKDATSHFLLANDAFCKLYNRTKEEIIGNVFAEDVPQEERERYSKIDKQVIAEGVENIYEDSFNNKDGETRFISTKKTRFIDRNGNKFLIGVIRDVTKRKNAEKEILQLGNRNTRIIETLLDGFILADTTGKILDANPAYINMIGYALEELQTMNINQLEVALNQSEIEERIKEMVSKGFARFNSNHKKKNGELIDLDVSTFTMQINGQHVVAAFVKDITERKIAEIEIKESIEKFSKAFNSNVIGKAIINKEKIIVEVNDALAKIVGFKRENMLGKTAEEIGLFNFDDPINLENEALIWREFSENGFASNIELKYLMNDGRELFILLALQALQLNNEDHVMITVIDITEKKNVETELEKHKNNLEELVESRTSELEKEKVKAQSADLMKSAFLATMSHELRTPMNSIIGFTGILLKELPGPLNDEQSKQLAMVKNSGEHLLALINDILDISKIEAGRLEVSLAPFNYYLTLENTIEFLSPQANKKDIQISTEISSMDFTLISDERRVEQILLNLLSNAIKFSNQGTILVKVDINNNFLTTQIIDQGIGISKENLNKLFTPFTQLDKGLNRSHEGSGLGLAICKSIIEKLEGTIKVTSIEGEGSNFTFILPIE